MKYLLGILALALMVLTASSCQPRVLARSASPDGKYVCDILGPSSSVLVCGHKFCYHFDVKGRKLSESLPGQSFEFDSELELQKQDFGFTWQGQRLQVSLRHAGSTPLEFVPDLSQEEQRWRQVR